MNVSNISNVCNVTDFVWTDEADKLVLSDATASELSIKLGIPAGCIFLRRK